MVRFFLLFLGAFCLSALAEIRESNDIRDVLSAVERLIEKYGAGKLVCVDLTIPRPKILDQYRRAKRSAATSDPRCASSTRLLAT